MNNTNDSLKLFESVGYAVISYKTDGTIVFWNKASEELYEWKSEEATGKNIYTLLNQSPETPNLLDTLGTGKNVFTELMLTNKSGKPCLIHSNYSPVFDDKNNLVSILRLDSCFCGNQMLEQELKQSKENFELFFNTVDEYLFVLDNKGNILHVNKSVVNRLGYQEEELIGKSVLFVHPEDRRTEAVETVAKMLTGDTRACFVPLQTKGGELISVETYVSMGEWNGAPAIYGVSKDITLLKQSEEKFSTAFHRNVAAMAVTSIEDNKFIDVNEAFLELMGYEMEEVIGNTAASVGAFKDPELRQKAVEEILSKGFFKNFEVVIVTKSGEEKVGLFSGEVIYIGEEKLLLTECIDITARKNVEMIVRESEENLRLLNSEKDKFFSVIAHDLRSPFTALLGLTDLMVKGINTYSIPELQKMSEKLSSSAQKLYGLLSNLLEWSMMQRNLSTYNPVSFSLNKSISDCITNEKHLISEKEILLETDIDKSLTVFADMHMIESTIRNLLTNAVKFTNRNGSIKISAKETTDNMVKVCVCDSGIGINNDMLESIFRLNSDFQRPGTEKEPSTGLGLLLCKDFVEKNNGKIWAESDGKTGSRFFFTLMKEQNLN